MADAIATAIRTARTDLENAITDARKATETEHKRITELQKEIALLQFEEQNIADAWPDIKREAEEERARYDKEAHARLAALQQDVLRRLAA